MTSANSSQTSPTINVQSDSPLIDARVSIRLSGFEPGQLVTVRAKTLDDSARSWEAYASFRTDAYGEVDLDTQKPLLGTYNEADAMGLFWSMTPSADTSKSAIFAKTQATPITVTLNVEVAGNVVTSTALERLLLYEGITHRSVRESGLMGTFFQPPDSADPQPGIIVLGGSGGGLNESRAALLSSHGYATLALAYFHFEQLPDSLVDIPLEYFETALHWLENQPGINTNQLAVIGSSKGGELALLLGATFPQIKAVVGYVPSSVIWQGLGETHDKQMRVPSSWSYHGKSLPFVPYILPQSTPIVPKPSPNNAISFTAMYLANLSDKTAVERATIPVEKINGPVLLVSAQDDRLWPSAYFGEMIMDRLARYKHPYPDQHLTYAGAGHLINFPYLPATPTQGPHSTSGLILEYGGNPKANAQADRGSWMNVLKFLDQNLKQNITQMI